MISHLALVRRDWCLWRRCALPGAACEVAPGEQLRLCGIHAALARQHLGAGGILQVWAGPHDTRVVVPALPNR